MKDRFVTGAIAGALSGVLINIIDFVDTNLLNFSDVRFMDYAAVLMYGNKSSSIAELILALIGQIMFSAFLGIIFSYLIVLIGTSALLFKGWFYSNTSWFFIHALIVLTHSTPLTGADLKTVTSNLISASVYGITMPWILAKIDNGIRSDKKIADE